MKNAKRTFLFSVGSLLLILSLFAVAAKVKLSSDSLSESLYRQMMVSSVTSLKDISDMYALEWVNYLPISLPHKDSFLKTVDLPVPLIFPQQKQQWDAAYSASFIDGLIPVVKEGITVFPIQILLSSAERTLTIYNANEKAIATVPIDDKFLPVEWAKECFGSATVETADRMQLSLDLILEADINLYIALQELKAAARPSEPDFPIIMMAYGGPAVTNIKFVAAETTNGCVMFTIAYPNDFTNDLEIFGCTNLLIQDWSLLATTNVNLSTNWIEWVDLDSSNHVQRFYDAWNADADTDSDGLSDGQEKRIYGTDRINPDTDGDGVDDGTEIALGMDPLSAAADSDEDGIADGWEVLNFGDLDEGPDIVVTNGGAQTIQQAINAASAGDIVLVLSGTYTNAGDKNLDFAGKGIYLLSEAGATSVTIDCQNSGRGFIFDSAETSQAVLSGFKVTGGYTNDGAAIYCATSSPTIKYCNIADNTATNNGGGIYLYGASPVITNCIIESNTASTNGGGIYAVAKYYLHHMDGATPVFWSTGSSPTIENCIIKNNLAGEGSAVYFADTSPGAPYLDPSDHDVGTPVVSRCNITRNRATNSSAVYAGVYVDATLENTMIVKNYTRAVLNSLGNLIVMNCTISDNVYASEDYGAGILAVHTGTYPGSTTIKNTIVDDNSPSEAQLLASEDNALCTVSYTAYDPTPYQYITNYVSLGSGNITNDAKTTADGHIMTTSPCIGAGTATGAPSSDFDGESRSVPVDIGADQVKDTDGDGMPDWWELKYGLNPLVANSGSANADGDELTDAQEYEAGTDPTTVSGDDDGDGLSNDAEAYYRTNPNDWDSDNDLFPDGWEVTYGYNANSSTNPAPTADDDSDGLSNFDEMRYGTNPGSTDSDGDGVSDGTEVTNGSDPADASDGGSADNCVSIELVVGDHSGSHSERYGLEIGHVYHVAPEWGVLATNTYSFVKGQAYNFNVKWIDTTNTPDPDYDYTATIGGYSNSVTSTNGYVISDPEGILGAHTESTNDFAAGKTGVLYLVGCSIAMDGDRDLVIDFDNPQDTTAGTNTFWINDDYDVRHWEENDWHEDDKKLYLFNSKDCNDDTIGTRGKKGDAPVPSSDNYCLRDLEDFTVIQLKVPSVVSGLNNVTYWMEFQNATEGTPGVNLFEATAGSSSAPFAYLTNNVVATSQAKKTKLYEIDSSETQIDAAFIQFDAPISFLLEGKSTGRGDLCFVVKQAGTEICRSSVLVNLKPITAFYDVFKSSRTEPRHNTKWEAEVGASATHTQTNTAYTAESDKYLLLVHGWNMAPEDKLYFSQTAFKRLWWKKYKGGFGLYDWPTLYDFDINLISATVTLNKTLHHYDNSEMIAWLSSTALSDLMASLNTSGQLRVWAHSMGNVVTGEALRKYSGGSNIKAYVASQAAVSGHAYDQSAPDADFSPILGGSCGPQTPRIYAYWHSGNTNSADTPYFSGNASKVNRMCNYYNDLDYALSNWELNNKLKPDGASGYKFAYGGSTNFYDETAAVTNRFYRDLGSPVGFEITTTNLQSRYAVFAYDLESWSKCLGQATNAAFSFHGLDLRNALDYDNQHYSHSKQFRSNIIDEGGYFESLIQDCDF